LVVDWKWHDTQNLETKILQVAHGLDEWIVYSPPGSGQGVVRVIKGPTPKPPKLIHALLRIEWVIQIITDRLCDNDDYIFVSVQDPRYWDQIKADVQQVVLTHQTLKDNA
jgi:hypothetical protein